MARRYRDAIKADVDPRGQRVVGPLEDHPPAVNGPAIAIVAIGGSGAFGQIRDAMPFLGADRLSVALPSRRGSLTMGRLRAQRSCEASGELTPGILPRREGVADPNPMYPSYVPATRGPSLACHVVRRVHNQREGLRDRRRTVIP